ncbi:MAG TPA: hypothetical protein VEE82_03715, partial [Thermodesulfovibrionales bacterium]|nr:hypothetical protein [Thermodesulfovibrionales bacterium]
MPLIQVQLWNFYYASPVITETWYLPGLSHAVHDNLKFIECAMALIYDLDNVFKKWCKELMGKYHGLSVNLANAPLVVVAGAENIRAVLCSTRTSKS